MTPMRVWAEPFGELRRLQDEAVRRAASLARDDERDGDEWREQITVVGAAIERYLRVEDAALLPAHERSVPFGREQAGWARERHGRIRIALESLQREPPPRDSVENLVAALRVHVDIMNADVYPRLWRNVDQEQLAAVERTSRAWASPQSR